MNTAELVDGLRNQDPLAAQCLNERYVPSIWRFVFFRVDRDTHLAEDIVSETVLALVSAAAEGNEIENPSAWMRTVAQRRIRDHFRAAARVQHLVQEVQKQTPDADTDDPVTKHDQKLQRESVRHAMDRLPDTYREVLEWKYVDRCSVKTIAENLDTSEKSAESLLFRARRALKKQLQMPEQEMPEHDPPESISPSPRPDEMTPPTEHIEPSRLGESPASNGCDSPTDRQRPNLFVATRIARQH